MAPSDTYVDPRVLRTKQRLFDALLELIQRRRWDKIRVQDLLEMTGVSRSAFYAHYDNKYDLLISGIPDVELVLGNDYGRPDLLPLFDHVNEMAPVLVPLMTQPVLSDIVDSFHRQFAQGWAAYLDETEHAGDPVLPEMLAGALTALMRSYALDKNREEPERHAARVAAHFERLLES